MKEHPILFAGEMVRAILEGRKTQTRRITKPQPFVNASGCLAWMTSGAMKNFERSAEEMIARHCPFGQAGDQLWVRESWKLTNWRWEESEQQIMYHADGAKLWRDTDFDGECDVDRLNAWLMRETEAVIKHPTTKESEGDCEGGICYETDDDALPWKSSIHMPRWASRLTLEVVDVRVERVQDISEEDCCRETGAPLKWEGPGPEPYKRNMRWSFSDLWNSINAKRGFGWDANPFVRVIEFKKVEP